MNIFFKKLALTIIVSSLSVFLFSCVKTDDYEKSIVKVDKLLQIVLNENLPKQHRIDALSNLSENIERILSMRESAVLSDAELEGILNDQINVISKHIEYKEKDTKIRVVSYAGPSELCGRQGKIWSFIQWWDDSDVYSQVLDEGGANLATDLVIQVVNDNLLVTLVGYSIINLPPPVFSHSLLLSNNRWEQINLFPTKPFDLKEYWYCEVIDDLLIIDHVLTGSTRIEISKRDVGFYVYSEMNPRDIIFFMFSNESLDYKLLQGPDLLVSSDGRSFKNIDLLFNEIEMSDVSIDDLSDLNLSEVVDLDSYETFESLDESKYMIAKAEYLTKISEYRTYIDAIQKSVVLLKGAQLSNEPRYQYLQAGEIHKYYNLLQANLIEQKSIIQLMLEELPNYYLNQEFDEDSIAHIEQFLNNGFSEEEITLFLKTDMTNEEIKAFENSLKLFFEELSLDAFYINEISTGLNEQLNMIDAQIELIKQAINELEEVSFN